MSRSDAPNAAKSLFCRVWLCPEEFSSRRVYEIHQESASGQSAQALREFERALVLDSGSAYRWADLAETMAQIQRRDMAKYCFQRAVQAGPNNPAILFRVANFYFETGDYPEMSRYLSVILRDPNLVDYYTPAFLTYARAGIPTYQILNTGIPPVALPARSYLRFLMEGGQVQDADLAWKWISERSLADQQITSEYLDFLIKKKEDQRAAEVWSDFNRNRMPDYLRTNWVFNGSFEAPLSSSIFDWHLDSSDDVQANRASDIAHDGRWSLEIAFDGKSNVDYRVSQEVALKPGKWHLQAFIRTEGLTTDEGLFLRVYDFYQTSPLNVATEGLTGTHDWTQVDRVFEVGPQIKLVTVQVARKPSMKFDNKIAGRAWVDSVELSPLK